MRLRLLPLLALLALASPLQAGERPQPALMGEEDLVSYMPEGARIETRLDVDLTGDGLRDLAFVARNEDVRVLKVMAAFANEVDMGYDPVGEMAMEPTPLGDASLRANKGVLIVEDLGGGTSAVQSLYRFRFDPKERRMRLIGDDVTFYSRTNAHGSVSISTNRLTGLRIEKRSDVAEDGYVDRPERRSRVSTAPIWMEDAPTPEDTLGLGG